MIRIEIEEVNSSLFFLCCAIFSFFSFALFKRFVQLLKNFFIERNAFLTTSVIQFSRAEKIREIREKLERCKKALYEIIISEFFYFIFFSIFIKSRWIWTIVIFIGIEFLEFYFIAFMKYWCRWIKKELLYLNEITKEFVTENFN